MSSWIVLTLRGRESRDYAFSRGDTSDRWDAVSDLYATAENDDRIRRATTGHDAVYAYAKSKTFGTVEGIIREYAPAVDDAVLLEANDTSDTGAAYYYPHPSRSSEPRWTDKYAETQEQDGYHVGHLALAVVSARHGIIARDPFHDPIGRHDERRSDDGQDLMTLGEVYDT